MESTKLIEIGTELPPITKLVTQEKINLFEGCGILERANIHTDPKVAANKLGTTYPIASGRMTLSYASEALRRVFGPEVFSHSGSLNLKFLRPVKDGDTVSIKGKVSEKLDEDAGTRIFVELRCENQNGDTTAVGTGSALIKR